MSTVLIYAEHKDGKIKKVTHELIAEATLWCRGRSVSRWEQR